MTQYVYWAAAQVSAAGTIVNRDDGFTSSISHVANSGDYTLTLTNAMDPTEFAASVQPLYFGVSLFAVAIEAIKLDADGVTVHVNLRNLAGLAVDSDFLIEIHRFSP